jgi:hypothetical protein
MRDQLEIQAPYGGNAVLSKEEFTPLRVAGGGGKFKNSQGSLNYNDAIDENGH